jgi:hypothetical protein
VTVPQEVRLARHAGDLDDDGHDTYGTGLTGFLSKTEGGQDTIKSHGSMGATETFDPTDGNVHTGVLSANCTVTLDPPTGSGASTLIGWFTQSGGPWTLAFAASAGGSFVWDGATPTIPSTGTFRIVFELVPGTTNDWVGIMVGGSGGSALTVKDEGSSLDTAVTSIDVVGSGATATNVGHAVTVTIPQLIPVMVEDGATGLWYVAVTGDGDAVMTEV